MSDDSLPVPNSSKALDASAITRADGVVVDRERVVLGSTDNFNELAEIVTRRLATRDINVVTLLGQILAELQEIKLHLL
jgi:hypothetical protein